MILIFVGTLELIAVVEFVTRVVYHVKHTVMVLINPHRLTKKYWIRILATHTYWFGTNSR